MQQRKQSVTRWLVAAVMLVLPVILLLSSLRSLRELAETKAVYLRNRTADLAVRLESLDPADITPELTDWFAAEEPALLALRVYASPDQETNDPVLAAIWRGETLFHTGFDSTGEQEIFRAYIPFHLESGLHIAKMDLAADAAEFLVEHTRHHLVLSMVASLALVAFTLYFLWSERRAVRFQRRELELEHLAHLGQMSAVLAHEIRNPLGTIKGFVQLGIEQAGDAAAGLLAPVLNEVARLEKLVNDLLLYGRPRTPELKTCTWPEMAAKLETHAREQIGDRPIRFSSSGDLAEFTTDPEMLEQALLNLIRNSVEAAQDSDGGEVALAANATPGGAVQIRVEDNGPGLPEEIRVRLFEPFSTTKSNGTGLGLSIVRKLTQSLGGSVTIEPREPRGTRAELKFSS